MAGPRGGREVEGVVWAEASGAWADGGCRYALELGEATGADK